MFNNLNRQICENELSICLLLNFPKAYVAQRIQLICLVKTQVKSINILNSCKQGSYLKRILIGQKLVEQPQF